MTLHNLQTFLAVMVLVIQESLIDEEGAVAADEALLIGQLIEAYTFTTNRKTKK